MVILFTLGVYYPIDFLKEVNDNNNTTFESQKTIKKQQICINLLWNFSVVEIKMYTYTLIHCIHTYTYTAVGITQMHL